MSEINHEAAKRTSEQYNDRQCRREIHNLSRGCLDIVAQRDAAQAAYEAERARVEALAGLVREAYEMDSWCHDNEQIHKPLPFEESDAAMNLTAILEGHKAHAAQGDDG